MAQIFAFREDRLGFRFQIDRKVILGRAPDCDLILFDRSASRQHAEIYAVEDQYYVADMASTNGTLVNDRPITEPARLEPFDAIKIGQELFIFEPKLDVIVGPAPSAIIIEELSEEVHNLITRPVGDGAMHISPDDVADLMKLARAIYQGASPEELRKLLDEHLKARFGMTYMSILWPSRPPAKRLISFLTSHDDKRLLLSHTPFIRALRDREALLWPNRITELQFNEGNRHVSHLDQPVLIGPLFAGREATGLLYLENADTPFNEKDLNAFSALLLMLSPAITALVDERERVESELLVRDEVPDASINLTSSDDQVKIIFSTAAQVASTNSSVLLSGEAGTGKAALAGYIHQSSPRKSGRLVTVSLSSIPANEIERALVGQAPESGEIYGQTGLMELADGGTLFLRHVEYLPPVAQKTLLMAMEEGMFLPLQAQRAKAVDLRVISSTSIDLWARVEAGYFREDLYARLNSLTISMPPLREIKNDLEWQVNSFMSRAARDLGLSFTGVDPAAMECLRAYPWPGNIAELKRETELMVLFSRNGRVVLEDLPVYLRMATDAFLVDDDELPPLTQEAERFQLARAMARCSGDLEAVAELLGQKAENLILKMRLFGLDPIDYQAPLKAALPKGPGQTTVPA